MSLELGAGLDAGHPCCARRHIQVRGQVTWEPRESAGTKEGSVRLGHLGTGARMRASDFIQ